MDAVWLERKIKVKSTCIRGTAARALWLLCTEYAWEKSEGILSQQWHKGQATAHTSNKPKQSTSLSTARGSRMMACRRCRAGKVTAVHSVQCWKSRITSPVLSHGLLYIPDLMATAQEVFQMPRHLKIGKNVNVNLWRCWEGQWAGRGEDAHMHWLCPAVLLAAAQSSSWQIAT